MQHDLAVFCGRFQPFHNGHLAACRSALQQADRLIILVGSSNASRSPKNPWTFEERSAMILSSLFKAGLRDRCSVIRLNDFYRNDNLWIAEVQRIASANSKEGDSIALVGTQKDETSYYLTKFPQWGRITPLTPSVNATDIRAAYFDNPDGTLLTGQIQPIVPTAVLDALIKFKTTAWYEWMRNEINQYRSDRARYGEGPHITTDAVVTCCGHVLLVKRKNHPGKDLWALPGGFLGRYERIEAGCLRELWEETGLKVPEKVLEGSIGQAHVWDHPFRSQRGRVITHAFGIDLKDTVLPKIRAASDAKQVRWVPINWVQDNPTELFEDHAQIVESIIQTKGD